MNLSKHSSKRNFEDLNNTHCQNLRKNQPISLKRCRPFTNTEKDSNPQSPQAPAKYNLCSSCDVRRADIRLSCGHCFHARCVWTFPIKNCPKCAVKMEGYPGLHILPLEPHISNDLKEEISEDNKKSKLRVGRWHVHETLYAENICDAFAEGLLAISEGTKLCPFLCKLLRCQAARLSKKMKIGKKHFKPCPRSAESPEFVQQFVNKQKKVSELEELFLLEEGQTQGGAAKVAFLSHNIQVTWRELFIGFAHSVNQKIFNAFQWNESPILFKKPQALIPRAGGSSSNSLDSVLASLTDVEKLQQDHPRLVAWLRTLLPSILPTSVLPPSFPVSGLGSTTAAPYPQLLAAQQPIYPHPVALKQESPAVSGPYPHRSSSPPQTAMAHPSPAQSAPPEEVSKGNQLSLDHHKGPPSVNVAAQPGAMGNISANQLSPTTQQLPSTSAPFSTIQQEGPFSLTVPSATSSTQPDAPPNHLSVSLNQISPVHRSPSPMNGLSVVNQMAPANPIPGRRSVSSRRCSISDLVDLMAEPLTRMPSRMGGAIPSSYPMNFDKFSFDKINEIPFENVWDNIHDRLQDAFGFVDVALDQKAILSRGPSRPTSPKPPGTKTVFSLDGDESPRNLPIPQPSERFQDYIGTFLETIPFKAVDVWVPIMKKSSPEVTAAGITLCHAGHFSLNEGALKHWGDYSTSFSFPEGIGLPGRVYKTRFPAWKNIKEMTAESFLRKQGAIRCGINTAFAVPVTSCRGVTFVIVFYSQQELVENANVKLFIERTVQNWDFDASIAEDSKQDCGESTGDDDDEPDNVETYEDSLDFFK